ncbi:hypothetical protein WA158_000165 [Blastocystis sp. Blastoise]
MAEEKVDYKKKVELGVGSDLSRTIVFYNEGHTLGNALRNILMQQEDIEFCGYSVPHPVEAKMHLRVQTKGTRAVDELVKSLNTLTTICNDIDSSYNDALERYNKSH